MTTGKRSKEPCFVILALTLPSRKPVTTRIRIMVIITGTTLIWGEELTNIGISGPGLIWGNGLSFGGWVKDKKRGDYPIYNTEPLGVGNKAIALKNCRNVIFRGFSILKCGGFGLQLGPLARRGSRIT